MSKNIFQVMRYLTFQSNTHCIVVNSFLANYLVINIRYLILDTSLLLLVIYTVIDNITVIHLLFQWSHFCDTSLPSFNSIKDFDTDKKVFFF